MTKDLTRGNPAKLIFNFTIPLLLGNIFQQFYSMADTIIVGRTVGVNALAAVGATGSIIFLILGFVQGLSSGFSVITAQRFGAQDEDGVRKSVAASIILGIIITLILTIFSVLLTRTILEAMNTPPEIIDDAYHYLIVIFIGIYASMMFNTLSNIIRALGDSKTPLYFLVIACILNVILDFILILSFRMGVAGAAWATIISQTVSGILCIIFIAKKLPILRFHKDDFRVDRHILFTHLRIGLPMAFQMSIIAIGAMILQVALNSLGATAVAAFTASQKIDTVATQPLSSFGVTMATYVAQNYGAGYMDRIKKGVNQCLIMSLCFAIAGGLIVIFAGPFLVQLFVGQGQKQVISLAETYLIINGSMYFMLALLFIYRNALQGLGHSLTPTLAGIMELVMRTIAALVLAKLLHFAGVSMANPVAWLGALIPLTISYYRTIKRLQTN